MYFYYGITHSSLENPSEEFELTVDGNGQQPPSGQKTNLKVPSQSNHREQTAVWDRHGYENRMATNDDGSELQWGTSNSSWNPSDAWGDTTIYDPPRQQQPPVPQRSSHQYESTNIFQPPPTQQRPEAKKDGFGMFYQETPSYPTWDD